MTKWNLFIDDERGLEDVKWAPCDIREKYYNEEWVIARTHNEVINSIEKMGCMPSFVSFDHDLGDFENGDGYKIAKYLVDLDMYTDNYNFPNDFCYFVHSKNPIGKENIESYLGNYLRIRNQ